MTKRVMLVGRAFAVALVAGLFGLLVWKIAGQGESVAKEVSRGENPPAPNFTLPRLDGEGDFELTSLRGKVVVLNWWATWCFPCRAEAPVLERAHRRWKAKDVVFVGVDYKDVTEDAQRFIRERDVTYLNVRDRDGKTLTPYGLTGVPETYFVDRRGRIVYRIAGPVEKQSELDEGIRRALEA